MAKTKLIEEETVVQPISEKTPLEAKISTEKSVKIHTMEEVDCIIANKPYCFAKDKTLSVPADVAAILCYAKKAYRL